jgi:hypothetical protein
MKTLINLINIVGIVVPVVLWIINPDIYFMGKYAPITVPCFIIFTVAIIIRAINCYDCTSDCLLSLYCEFNKKVKLIKRLLIFFNYDKTIIENIDMSYVKYKDDIGYLDIYKQIIYEYNIKNK